MESAARKLDDQPFILGIDEAGRGPVLGHMVYSTCVCPAARREDLAKLNFDDSKALTAAQRERMFAQIQACEWLDFKLDPISPTSISAAMLKRNKTSLNELAANSTIALVQAWLNEGYNVQEMYVDTLGSPEHYQAKLARHFPQIGKIVVAKKADSLYPIVSAASICAKVTRDRLLRDWKPPGLAEGETWPAAGGAEGAEAVHDSGDDSGEDGDDGDGDEDVGDRAVAAPVGRRPSRAAALGKRPAPEPSAADGAGERASAAASSSSSKRIKLLGKPLVYSNVFGSGYPGDPATKKWLNSALDPVFGFPSLVRHSWKTAALLVDDHCVPVDWGEDDDGTAAGGGTSGSAAAAKKKAAAKDSKLNVLVSAKVSAKHNIPLSARASHFRQHHLQLVVSFDA